ncbi:hypothetical protein TNCV_3407171 [Trichonephila clavipes]|nr:hypothetical protein TNCV_3407171 [Trichonephila clavipes]
MNIMIFGDMQLGVVVGLSLAFCTQGNGIDPGPSRWIFVMKKINNGHAAKGSRVIHENILQSRISPSPVCEQGKRSYSTVKDEVPRHSRRRDEGEIGIHPQLGKSLSFIYCRLSMFLSRIYV